MINPTAAAGNAAEPSNINSPLQDLEANHLTTGIELRQGIAPTTLRQRRPYSSSTAFSQNFGGCLIFEFLPAILRPCSAEQWPRSLFVHLLGSTWRVQIYRDMRKRWYEHRGRWRRLLPFRGAVSVREIKVLMQT